MTADPLTEAADDLLASLTEDDLMYDMPVSMSGEPMDPVLYVRWEAVSERIAPLVEAARDYVKLHDTMNYPETAAMYPASLRAALAEWEAHDDR